MLQGHERPITKIKYNREGDLLFSSSKDKNPNVWYSLNGERLGTFNGHMGSVWCIDVNWDTTRFLSGSGDNTLRIWDCQTGKEIGLLKAKSSVRTCSFSYSGNLAVYSTDKTFGHQCEMFIIDAKNIDVGFSQGDVISKIAIGGPRISAILWGALDETVITGHEDGEIIIWDVKTRQKLKSAKCHKSQINDMQFNKDGTMFVTASKDNTAKLFDSDSLTLLKTYKTERPVNSATISPTFDHFPEPPPLDYYITDISPTFVADGIFYHGKPTATHKYVANQLKPIKRTVFDPSAPIAELDSRTLERWLAKEKERYVAPPEKDDGIVYQTLSIMPRWKHDQKAQKRWTSVEPCALLKPPIWWKGKTKKSDGVSVANINDYSYMKLKDQDEDVKLSEKLHMDHPKKYTPGMIYRLKNPEDTSMKDALDRADAFKVVLKTDDILPEDTPVDKCVYEKYPRNYCGLKEDQDVVTADPVISNGDNRWQPLHEDIDFPTTDLERQKELRELTKPFLHDLHTWHSKNKPTKLIIPIKHRGKKAIPGRRFPHL
ncbi:Eukaryotic translation initiation factor 3 subunit I [Eufriesea mexicana]|uniref:Serine-threonine kinase receptor-associated protein n=1 Tax=Eufriesea mexicana TaxID=516756 RepID=A0A310SCX4_9HYME|nr:Eukaryotic translation initiation factor 3 subunit I [Eufriesea mexicana]